MGWITLEIRGGANAFLPGETIEGTASWNMETPLTGLELRLIWYTEGKGDQDFAIVETVAFPQPAAEDSRAFHFLLPEGPYSFSGKLISLRWALEPVAQPGERAGERHIIVVSPTRHEIQITPPAPG